MTELCITCGVLPVVIEDVCQFCYDAEQEELAAIARGEDSRYGDKFEEQ